jgi:hypothetical protein
MYAVILAGGGGTRLHPLSRPERPKPFLPLVDDRSLLQHTVDRLRAGGDDRLTDDIVVVSAANQRDLVAEQLPDIEILTEPTGRNTAAAIALATTAIDRPDDLTRLTDRGAILGFDLFGFDHSLLGPGRYPPSDHEAARFVARLVQAGHRDRLILSQDVGVVSRLRRFGSWGYAHLLEHVVPILRGFGLTEDDLDAILVRTPARLLSVPA